MQTQIGILAIGIMARRFPAGSDKPFAIRSRMEALIPLMKDKRAKGWSFDVEPGCSKTHPAMFRAAAMAPIYMKRNERGFRFKKDEFFRIVLEGTEDAEVV